MKGLSSRIVRLEDAIACPKCKTALTCPECSQHEEDELSDEERLSKASEFLAWAKARLEADAMFDEPTDEPHGHQESLS